MGTVTLQTCLLPEREKPYLLSLELARHRLMLLLNKLEDWALFDLAPTDPGMVLFEKARKAFTEAVVAQGAEPGEEGLPYSHHADILARKARMDAKVKTAMTTGKTGDVSGLDDLISAANKLGWRRIQQVVALALQSNA